MLNPRQLLGSDHSNEHVPQANTLTHLPSNFILPELCNTPRIFKRVPSLHIQASLPLQHQPLFTELRPQQPSLRTRRSPTPQACSALGRSMTNLLLTRGAGLRSHQPYTLNIKLIAWILLLAPCQRVSAAYQMAFAMVLTPSSVSAMMRISKIASASKTCSCRDGTHISSNWGSNWQWSGFSNDAISSLSISGNKADPMACKFYEAGECESQPFLVGSAATSYFLKPQMDAGQNDIVSSIFCGQPEVSGTCLPIEIPDLY